MASRFLLAGAVGALLVPSISYAQSSELVTAAGAATGAVGGAVIGGPVGAVLGGAAGAIVGGLAGPKEQEPRPCFEGAQIGAVLVSYRHAPAHHGVRKSRRTAVSGIPVLVDPKTCRIVQVIR